MVQVLDARLDAPAAHEADVGGNLARVLSEVVLHFVSNPSTYALSLIHISEPTRPY